MGCLKLTYRSTLEVVKPAQGFLFYFPTVIEIAALSSEEKTDAGIYRYGFNGMEKDDNIKGSGNSYTTHFRQLDPRLGRWLSIDPKMSAWESPYVSMGNTPIWASDPMGDKFKKKSQKKIDKFKKQAEKRLEKLETDIMTNSIQLEADEY